MTGRVCHIHGEYAADGVCRWCELPTEYDWTRGPAVETPEELARIANIAPALSSSLQARLDEAWRRHQTYLLTYYHPEWALQEEQGFAAQHAALRWERVARRWDYKHRGSWTGVYLDWQRCLDEMHERLRRSFALREEPP